jgi:hypothetical protein
MIKKERLPIVFFAMFCLLSGLWSGLTRIGWNLSILPITAHHGAIMVGGFLGTLIILEKIIPLQKKSLYLIPVVNASSVLFFLLNRAEIAISILVVTSVALSFVFLYFFWLQRSIVYALMVTGAICWMMGNILLLTKSFYPLAFPWWTAFALFIVSAERLELTKFLPVSRSSKNTFVAMLLLFVIGVLFSFHGIGNFVCGVSLGVISLWLMRNDLIAINLKKISLPKYIAIALLSGYISLLLTGIFFIVLSDHWLTYDVIVHSFFIGFVFSMIFAHGPIILPSVMGIAVTPFHKILYLWLALLQTSWIVRTFSDVFMEMELRRISALLTAAAILGYFATIAILIIRRQSHAKTF